MQCVVHFFWDEDAKVWIATSKDVPGLVLESGSFDALLERIKYAIPELLELNSNPAPFYDLFVTSERHEKVAIYG